MPVQNTRDSLRLTPLPNRPTVSGVARRDNPITSLWHDPETMTPLWRRAVEFPLQKRGLSRKSLSSASIGALTGGRRPRFDRLAIGPHFGNLESNASFYCETFNDGAREQDDLQPVFILSYQCRKYLPDPLRRADREPRVMHLILFDCWQG
jgi:hypothetical protein